MAQTVTTICNLALQKVGAKPISSIDEDSRNGRACKAVYETVRDAEIEAHPWDFATQRFSLAADATSPEFTKANRFKRPTGCLKVLPPDPEDNSNDRDWQIEGDYILTNYPAPLQVRCVMRIENPGLYPPTFVQAFATSLALELVELLTQSNSKKTDLENQYKTRIAEARRANAFQRQPAEDYTDTWITARF